MLARIKMKGQIWKNDPICRDEVMTISELAPLIFGTAALLAVFAFLSIAEH